MDNQSNIINCQANSPTTITLPCPYNFEHDELTIRTKSEVYVGYPISRMLKKGESIKLVKKVIPRLYSSPEKIWIEEN